MVRRAPLPASVPAVASHWDWRWALLVLGATFVAYLPALRGQFIWNDNDYVTAPLLRSLAGLAAIWFKPGATEQYYPLLHSFFWVQHKLWGDAAPGYHLVTQLLHAGAAVLFALCLRRLAVPGAWLAALIFALHPVHVESVAWITEQKNTLSLVFYLAAAWLYLDYDETRRGRAYAWATAFFAISLLCKTVTATLPAALLVIFWWKRGRLEWSRDVKPLLPWLILGAAIGLFTSWVEQHFLGAKGADFDASFLARGLVAGRAVWFYLGKVFWPADLNFIYPRWTPDPAVWWQWLYPLAALGLAAGLWAMRARNRTPLAVLLLFTGSLFPVLGFVNLYGALYSWVWDHWQYLPDLAPIALVAASLTIAWNRTPPAWRPFGSATAAVLLVMLGVLSWRHTRMFRDNETLYQTTLARNPGAWMACFNLGGMRAKDPARLAEAVLYFEQALALNPGMADAHYNLGTTLARMPGRLDEAFAHFEAALRLTPKNAAIHFNYGNALGNFAGRWPEAIAHYREAIRLQPDFASAQLNLGNALIKDPARRSEALVCFREAIRLNPGLAEAHYNLGMALVESPATIPEAMTHFEIALKTRDFPAAREILARWRMLQQR